MYPIAVKLGIPASEFWSMTYDEIVTQVEANVLNKEEALKEQAMMDYKRAQLISYSVNDPKKMPKFEDFYSFSKEETEDEAELKLKQEQDYMIMQMARMGAMRQLREER